MNVNKHPLLPVIIVIFLFAVFFVGFLPNLPIFIALKLILILVLGGSAFYLTKDILAGFFQPEPSDELQEAGEPLPQENILPDLPEIKTVQNIEEYFERFLSTIFPLIKQTIVCDTVVLLMINFQRKQFYIRHKITEYQEKFTEQSFLDINQGLMALVLRNKKSICENHLPDSDNLLPYYTSKQLLARSFIGAPLYFNDNIIGILCVDSHVEEAFSLEDEQILNEFSETISIQLACSNRLYEYETENWTTKLLYDFSKGILDIQSAKNLWQYLGNTLKPVFSTDRILIVEKIEENKGRLVYVSGDLTSLKTGIEYPDNEGLLGWVLRKNQSLTIDDFSAKENYIPRLFQNENPDTDLNSLLAVPVTVDEEAHFVISLESRKAHQFSEQHKKILETMAYQVAAFLKKDRTIDQLIEENLVDPETGLGNEKALIAELNKEVLRSNEYNKCFCLQMLKIKVANHTIDSITTERLISEFAAFVLPLFNSIAFLFRLENDTLAILWPEKTIDEALTHFQEAYKKIDLKSSWIDGLVEKIYLNGGIVSFPQKGSNSNELMSNAGDALKKAELKGPNTIEVYREYEKIETE